MVEGLLMAPHRHFMHEKDVMSGDLMGLQITGSVLMNIVPMDTMNGGREDLIGQDITIRITIEILASGLYNMGSIILLGVEVQTVLMLMTPDTNLGLGSSFHCPVWYTGISTGMI